jgi:hypothetical protein
VAPLMLIVALLVVPAAAQSKKAPARKRVSVAKKAPEPESKVITAAKEHKANLESEVALLDEQIKRDSEEIEKKRELLELGIIAKREIEDGERKLELIRAQRNARQSEVGQTDNLIAEVSASEQIAKLRPLRAGGYSATSALIRYAGSTTWRVFDIAKVESFFGGRFGRSLPISALGQTSVHDRMGLDHRASVDIAIHPDSAEGQSLIAYLRSMGIPFIAFRQAVPGAATGAHIHIGLPSKRLGRS